MALSAFLKMVLLTVGQDDPETTANDALVRIEDATQRMLEVDLSAADATLTEDQFTTNFLFKCTGHTVARILTVPLTVDGEATPINRSFHVKNEGTSSGTVEVKGITGTGYTVATGKCAHLYCDGTDVFLIGSVAA